MRNPNRRVLEVLEGLTADLDEDCGEPGCPECEQWRPVRDLMKDLRTAMTKPTNGFFCPTCNQREMIRAKFDEEAG